jgi:hypothetical protein
MFEKLQQFWKKHGFEIVLVLCVAFILIYALCRLGKKGSYSKTYSYTPGANKPKRKGPPKVSKGEAECRRVLQDLFKKPFPNMRPDFLRNPVTGNQHNLELDCYNADLSLAVEYSGIQHYKYDRFFHRSKDHFLNQKYRDDMKKRMCKEYGVNLIEVPYTVKIHEIKPYLIRKLKAMKYL